MSSIEKKPKLVFFQFRYDAEAPQAQVRHKDEHVRCLQQFFDVTVISEDCDYQQVCETHEPELAVFETGLQIQTAHRLDIRNATACRAIPRVAFLHADAWADTRAGTLSDLDHWEIETCFSICTTAAEHNPMLADRLFVWPNFIDPDVFRDYGQPKIAPVLLSGCQDPQYPWRHKVYPLISRHYPSLVLPHAGYRSRSRAGQVLHGEEYARALNASWFSPTCGTTAREFLRKHIEIPGCRTCLLTEEAPILKAAGFSDMENCVLVDEHTVIDKLSYLFQHRDLLEQIADAGHRLVHARHTMKDRDQLYQWFSLHRTLRPGQRIVQPGFFEPLAVTEDAAAASAARAPVRALHLQLFEQADALLWARRFDEAERLFSKSANYMGGMMAEPQLRLALCSLYRGRPAVALSLVVALLQVTLERYKAVDPDPVEWAYLIITLLCLGRLEEAEKRSREVPWLRHSELDRARTVVGALRAGPRGERPAPETGGRYRESVHRLPLRSDQEWTKELCLILASCGRTRLVDQLQKTLSWPPPGSSPDGSSLASSRPTRRDPGEDRVRPNGGRTPRVAYPSLRSTLRHAVAQAGHSLERRFGYFLPFAISEKRKDEFYAAVHKLASEEDFKTALVIGRDCGKGAAEAFLAGASENEGKPSVFCIGCSEPGHAEAKPPSSNSCLVARYELAPCGDEDRSRELARQARRIKGDFDIAGFDVVLIEGAGAPVRLLGDRLLDELEPARFVVLDGINSIEGSDSYTALLKHPDYVAACHDVELRNGYAIFRKDDE